MELVTLETGPYWKMQLLHGVLQEHGIPSFLEDATLDWVIPGAPTRVTVPRDALEAARTVLAEQRVAERRDEAPHEAEPR